jgi:hypothetical protein
MKASSRLGSATQYCEVSDCTSLDEARREVFKFATSGGWTIPKWWQYRRWNDSWWTWPKEVRETLEKEAKALISQKGPQSEPKLTGLSRKTVTYLGIGALGLLWVVYMLGLWWIRYH